MTLLRAVGLTSVFLLIGGLAMGPVVVEPGNRLPYPAHSLYSDLTLTHWSAFEYTRQQLAAGGELPLWRTSILSGTPFAANPLSGLFYPPHGLTLLTSLPMAPALNLLLWLHLSLAAAAMYALLRRWGVNRSAALASALAYAAAPKMIAHMGLGHLTLVEAWAWLPLVLYPHPRPFSRRETEVAGDRGGAIVSGLALGLCVLADVRLAVYAAILAISYRAVCGARRDGRAWLKILARITIMLIVALSLSAAVWVPAVSLSGETSRAALSVEEAGTLSLDPIYLLGLLIPDRSGAAERTTYAGVAVLALAGAALWRNQTASARLRGWLIAVIVLGAVLALGTHTPLYELIYRLPGASLLRVPARAWLMVSFALAALAGLGLHRLGASIQRAETRKIAGAIGLLIIAIDLLPVDWAVYRVVTVDEAFARGREAAAWLKQQPGSFRVYSPSLSIPQHVAQQFDLQLADGVDPLQLARYVSFMQSATGVGAWGYSVTLPPFPGIRSDDDVPTALKAVTPDAARLGLLNVKYVLADFPIAAADLIERARFDQTIVYENLRWRPRVFMESAAGAAVVLEYGPNRLVVEARGPGRLVLSEVYAADWTTSLDGQPAATVPVAGTLRGVDVPAGVHIIVMAYQPRAVYAGVLISLLSVIAGAGVLAVCRWLAR